MHDNKDKNLHQYDDIINLPHHVSKKHPQMARMNRAAQFAPFAALTGYEDAINETGRLTDEKIELDENSKEMLDARLQLIQDQLLKKPVVTVTYFKADEQKAGGSYLSNRGFVKKIDYNAHALVMQDETIIWVEDIINLQGDLFRQMDGMNL